MGASGFYVNPSDGLGISMKAMHTEMLMLNTHTDNISNYGVPGYQRKRPVITSFNEYLGPNGVDEAVDTEIGRLNATGRPLDLALNTQGYFQRVNKTTGAIELTRDGRFMLDTQGWLRSIDGKKILSTAGTPIQFSIIPQDPEKEIKVSPSGDVQVYSPLTGKATIMGRLGIANERGSAAQDVQVLQGHVEEGNVLLQQEYMAMMPIRREFEANRQMFIIQDDALSRVIQELGRAQ